MDNIFQLFKEQNQIILPLDKYHSKNYIYTHF